MSESDLEASLKVSPAFRYRQLPAGYIQLMILPSGDDLTTLKCTILYVHVLHPGIKTVNSYNALSYTWGDPTDTISLELLDVSSNHAGKIRVTKSPVSALQHVRDSKRSLAFLADRVCIDQSNTEEKEMQISLQLIYESRCRFMLGLGQVQMRLQTRSHFFERRC
jgi:hypothetical protein